MYQDLIEVTRDIHGWLTRKEAICLYELVGQAPGNIVEIGAWKGLSTSWLLVAAYRSGKQLTTVDHFIGSSEHRLDGSIDTYPEFCQNIDRIQRRFGIPDSGLNVLKMDSLEASKCFDDSSIGMIFIDGSHEYELVKADMEAWRPKVISGGIIALHDANFGGPKKVLAGCGPPEKIIDSLAYFHRQ